MYGYWQQQFCMILFYRFGAIEPKVMWKDGLQSIALLFHHNFHSNYYWYLPRSRHTSRWALLFYIGWKQETSDRLVDWPVSLPRVRRAERSEGLWSAGGHKLDLGWQIDEPNIQKWLLQIEALSVQCISVFCRRMLGKTCFHHKQQSLNLRIAHDRSNPKSFEPNVYPCELIKGVERNNFMFERVNVSEG